MSFRCRMFTPAILILMAGMLGACRCQTNERPFVSQIRIEPAQPDYTIVVGQEASLMVNAAGDNLRFQWKTEKGKLSSPASSSTLYTAPDEPSLDTASVKVTGNCGVTEQSITIRVVPRSTSTSTPTTAPTSTFTPTPSPSPSFTPTPTPTFTPTSTPSAIVSATVALRTWSGRYVTVTDFTTTGKLKAQDTPIGDQQKFTLLCLANGKAALQIFDRFVSALNDEDDRNWELRAVATERLAWEEFTLVNPDTQKRIALLSRSWSNSSRVRSALLFKPSTRKMARTDL